MQLKIYRSETIDCAYNRLFKDLSVLRDGNTKHIIVVPDRMTLNCEKEMFENLKEKCFFDVEVVTLSRLANRYIEKAGFQQKVLSKIGATAVVKKILLENADKFQIFSKACKQQDFANVVFETISMFKSCLVKPEDIQPNSSNPVLNKKLAEIKLVYEEYEKFLKNDYVDSFNRLNLFTKLITKEVFKNTCLYFWGHNDFTPQMMAVISKFLKTAKNVNVLVCDGGKNSRTIFNNQTTSNLISMAEVCGSSYDVIDCENSFDSTRKAIATGLFVGTKINNANYLQTYKFDSIEDEVEYVAKKIRYSVVVGGEKYKKFTIITSSLNLYKPYIENAFDKYDIPYFLDMSENFAETAVVRYIKSLLNLLMLNKQKEGFSILKNPLSMLPLDEVFTHENNLLKFGCVDCFAGEPSDKIKEFLSLLKGLMQKDDVCKTISDHIAFVKEIYTTLKLDEKIEGLIQSYLSQNNVYEARVLQQVPNKLQTVLDEMEKILGDYPCDAKTFIEILSSCDGLNLTLPPIVSDSVFVADYNASFTKPNDNVFVLGVSEGAFPKYEEDAGLISDADIAELNWQIKLGPSIKQINKRLKFKAYESLLKAKNHLCVSYVVGSEGAFPSSLITRLVKMFDNQKFIDGSLMQNSPFALENGEVENVVFNNISKHSAEENFVKAISNYSLYGNRPHFAEYINSLYNVLPQADELVQNLCKQNVKENISNTDKVFFKRGTTSVSQFERYYSCPYKHFVDYGLRLKRRDVGEVENIEIGNIIHEYVRIIIPILRDNKDNYLDEQNLFSLSDRCFDEVLQMDIFEGLVENHKNNFILYSLKEECKRISKALLKDLNLSKFQPAYLEKEFIYDGKIKDKNGVSVKIRGFIDRIDVFENKFRIIDYKTGNEEFKNYTSLNSGKKLQLFIYEKAFENNSKYQPVGAFYMPLSNSLSKDDEYAYRLKGVLSSNLSDITNMDSSLDTTDGSSELLKVSFKNGKISEKASNLILAPAQISHLGDIAFAKMEQAMTEINNGNINPQPLQEANYSACTYCKYRGMCGFDESLGNKPREVETVSKYEGLEVQNESK